MAKIHESDQPLTETAKPFATILTQLEGGVLNADLSDMLRDLNAKMSEHAENNAVAKGELVLTLKMKIERGGLLEIQADAKVKAPKFQREKSHFWLTPGNNLTPENPKQPALFPRSVPGTQEKPRDVVPAVEPARKA